MLFGTASVVVLRMVSQNNASVHLSVWLLYISLSYGCLLILQITLRLFGHYLIITKPTSPNCLINSLHLKVIGLLLVFHLGIILGFHLIIGNNNIFGLCHYLFTGQNIECFSQLSRETYIYIYIVCFKASHDMKPAAFIENAFCFHSEKTDEQHAQPHLSTTHASSLSSIETQFEKNNGISQINMTFTYFLSFNNIASSSHIHHLLSYQFVHYISSFSHTHIFIHYIYHAQDDIVQRGICVRTVAYLFIYWHLLIFIWRAHVECL